MWCPSQAEGGLRVVKLIARIAAVGLLLTGLSFAKRPNHRWRGEDRTAYRMYDRGYRGQWNNPARWSDRDSYRYRSYGYRDYRGFDDSPRGLMWRRDGLPPGLVKKYRRDGVLPPGWQKRGWRAW